MIEGILVKNLELFRMIFDDAEEIDGASLERVRNGLVSLIALIDEELHIQDEMLEDARSY